MSTLDISITLRYNGIPSINTERAHPPAVSAGQLIRRTERCLTRDSETYKTAVLFIMDRVLGYNLVTYMEQFAGMNLLTDIVAGSGNHFTEETPADRKTIAGGLD